MRIKFSMVITLVITIFLSSCKQNYITIDFTNAKGEVPQLTNLVFRFNKAIYPDSLLNDWQDVEFMSFEPKIPGRFRWNGPEELVFSPSQPLSPATMYKGKFSGDLFKYSKYNEVEGDDITFHTAPLQLGDAFVTWLMADGRQSAVPQLTLKFNYPVATDDVKNNTSVTIDGNKVNPVFTNSGSTNEIILRLPDLKAENKTYEGKLVIEDGIKPDKGNEKTKDPITWQFTIPSPQVLNINNIESEHTGTEGIIRVYTTQQLTGEPVSSMVSFDPAVPYSVEYTDFGMTLRSDKFDVEKGYSLNIKKGLKGRIGGELREDYSGNVAFGQLEADVRFTNNKAIYLSKSGAGNIEVRVTGTDKIKLIISKIYESNLLHATSNGYEPREEDRQNEDEYEYSSHSDITAGDVVFSKEIDTRSLPKSGGGRILNISQFEDRLPDATGIYHVMIRSTDDYWVRDSRFISFSDIGLIARQSEGRMVVFANSIKTAKSVDGVTVNVYGRNNQLLGTGATNGDGVADITIKGAGFAGYKPAMIIAKTANDFTYLPFNNTKVNTSRFDVGGKTRNSTGLDAFIYAERDIYRPGEKLNYGVVVRDKNMKAAEDLPVRIKFLLPNGKELKTFRKGLNEQGATDGSLDVSPSAITGSYTMELYSSNEVLLAAKNFMIEEFVPDRIRITAKLDKPFLRPAESTTLQINAVNFFGPPAANRNYETEIQLKQKQFASKKYPDFDFTLANQQSFTDKQVRQGITDANGNASLIFDVPANYANIGLLQADFYTTVFDETGRPVSRITTADIFTQDVFHGIKNDGYYYYALNQPVNFQLVSANKEGNPANANAVVRVIKHEYKTILSRSGDYFRYDSQKEDKIISEKQMNIGDKTPFAFVPRSPGEYEIRIYRPLANAYVSKSFYSYGSWGSESSSFEVNTEGHIDIETDKQNYSVGDKARVLFKTPFSGRMLITTERDGVLSYEYLDVSKRSASYELKLDDAHVPNIYITATLIKPHDASDMPLTVAHGFQSIKVDAKGRKMDISITAQKNVRSKTHQKVQVKAIPGSYVSLAAVDNGILQVSDFKTPDPYHHYYQKQALGVSAFDMYPLLFPELRGRLSSTGGDGDISLEKRVNPLPAKRFKLMSYWSGIKKANGNGVAEFEFDIPQFSGELRLMAVAFKDEQFGSAESTTTVADPLVVSSSLPRFASPGDTLLVPVMITNTTGRTATGQATVSVGGPLKVVGAKAQNINLAPNSEGRTNFQVVADRVIDVGKVIITVNAFGEKFIEETELSVRPPSTLQKLSGSGSVVGGSTQKISIPQENFLPGSFKYDLVVSRSPIAEVADHLRYLVNYPYGCTEQTVSAAFPQLYYGDFVDALGLKGEKQNAAYNVTEAIRKIKMRQLYNGAVTLWDGEGEADWWTTIYAAHFLLEARKAGFDVDNSLTETMLSYLTNRLKAKQTINYYYNRDQQKKITPKEVAYSLYVLSIANRPQVSTMNYYKSNPALLAIDSRYLLSASYAVAGDRRSFGALLPNSFTGEESVKQTGGSFYSAMRDESIALNALLDVDPGNAQIPVMIQHVSKRLKTERYPNTQERSFAFLALGKVARNAGKSTVTAEVRSEGKTIANVSDKDWKGNSTQIKSGNIEITTKGTGRLYYSWVAEGISTTGAYVQEDNYVKVRRQFYDRNGKQISSNSFRQNDLIIVGITLDKAFDAAIENVVITDLLPAGFEIENPRTKEIPGMDWIRNASEPVALDVRDDRIHLFVNAYSKQHTYYYAVRAVSLGQFRQGPVSADAMYNGEIHSYHGAQMIRVLKQ